MSGAKFQDRQNLEVFCWPELMRVLQDLVELVMVPPSNLFRQLRSKPFTIASLAEASSFHAPEVECIGKGKASAPYEFGVKASIVTTNARAPGGQFVLHAKALPANPYDGHTLGTIIDATETLTGCAIERGQVDKGYRGHDTAGRCQWRRVSG